ncbi:diphthamide biosynthesis protein 5 [Reticulomyxa filosa]|uniref:Diphthamide biosynthesis protein 5 n=1 Tax=Reticulomyxa filosa TaxID=46433 RepID=X6M4B2_RETFI|nr:diphthamide biosynthesis protein 5 [Reticulomyxa filosa]|eukprot:ETO08451.1 diphthamide biosynthesis protein 5 [Reticulomyxa filosa]
MTINLCIEQLLEIENQRKENVYNEETKCIGLARVGNENQQIVYGTMKELKQHDFGEPLHSFVIPGTTHYIEEEVLDMYAIAKVHAKTTSTVTHQHPEVEQKTADEPTNNDNNSLEQPRDVSQLITLAENELEELKKKALAKGLIQNQDQTQK